MRKLTRIVILNSRFFNEKYQRQKKKKEEGGEKNQLGSNDVFGFSQINTTQSLDTMLGFKQDTHKKKQKLRLWSTQVYPGRYICYGRTPIGITLSTAYQDETWDMTR